MHNDVLRLIADNPALTEALRALLESKFLNDSKQTDEVSDQQLGQMYRARLIGLEKIDETFREIAKYKTQMEIPEPVNRAR